MFAGRAVRILIHACRLCLVGTGSTVLCVSQTYKSMIGGENDTWCPHPLQCRWAYYIDDCWLKVGPLSMLALHWANTGSVVYVCRIWWSINARQLTFSAEHGSTNMDIKVGQMWTRRHRQRAIIKCTFRSKNSWIFNIYIFISTSPPQLLIFIFASARLLCNPRARNFWGKMKIPIFRSVYFKHTYHISYFAKSWQLFHAHISFLQD